MTLTPLPLNQTSVQRPDALGRYGKFGGKYVPETLMPALSELETAFYQYRDDPEFRAEFQALLKDYVGRATPLYFAERLTTHFARP
ncbi:MAG: tryptophan synthase subunit beta, partial [Cyanobacteriota bacterium]